MSCHILRSFSLSLRLQFPKLKKLTFFGCEAPLLAQVDDVLADLTAAQVGVGGQLYLPVGTWPINRKLRTFRLFSYKAFVGT